MLQDIIHPPEQHQQLPIKDIASPISTNQLFELCGQELFPETLQNSEVSSCSNCCYEENSYTTNLSFSSFSSFPSDRGKSNNNNNSNTNSSSTLTPTNTNNNLSIIFDCSQDENENDNDISASIDFSPQSTFSNVPPQLLPTQQDQLDLSSLQCQIPITDVGNGFSSYCTPDSVVPLKGPPLPSVFVEDDCLSPLPSYVRLDPSSPSCSFLDPTNFGPFLPGNLSTARIPTDASGVFAGNILMDTDLQPQELDFQGDNCGVYGSDPLQQVYSSGDIQALHNDSSQLVNGGGTSTLSSEISTLEESTYKVGKLSVEERKEKIHRYMKKRNERNFSKKIKYACRKTLADSRPRVRGRFAKNDDFGEAARPSCSNHEDEDDEEVAMKEEELVDHSDIFAHISGVNSFKCNFPIQSWI
ncbi:two-component response regulator-like APRR7 [Macadamia integrifolia]|uniref:two-component response regulator-like APRR7 n=1 Tax=Macadamia integrifolia TaxID=60698 RepID=UPI001C4FD82E|nr:two-component response regulator-like APRR7 [Macadamia integrifolia]